MSTGLTNVQYTYVDGVYLGQPRMNMDYKTLAKEARLRVLDLVYKAQSSHIGSNFSCIDILTVLFEKMDLEKDKFICSKGWVAASVYHFLEKKGVITEEELLSFNQGGSKFIGLIEPMKRFGLEFAGGSMGYGLPAAVGYALSKKLKGEEGTVYVLLSDGELQIGTTWEALLLIKQHRLGNIIVIVDDNGLQAMGNIEDILSVNPPMPYVAIDGHNYNELERFVNPDWFGRDIDAPHIVCAVTTKGKGVSFMENNNLYHYKQLSEKEYLDAKEEITNG